MRLTTFLTKDYFPGLQTLAYSLCRYGNVTGLEWHVIWAGDVYKGYEEILGRYGFKVVTYKVEDFEFEVPDVPGAKNVLKIVKNKMLMWLLPPDDTYIYIDVDIICKKDAREMLEFTHFTAMKRPPVKNFCTGFIVFQPNKKIFKHLIEEILPSGRWRLLDQDILNLYFMDKHPENVKLLPWKWNTSKKETRQSNWNQLFSEAIFIHYHGVYKPWFGSDPDGYKDSHNLWHRLYNEAQETRLKK